MGLPFWNLAPFYPFFPFGAPIVIVPTVTDTSTSQPLQGTITASVDNGPPSTPQATNSAGTASFNFAGALPGAHSVVFQFTGTGPNAGENGTSGSYAFNVEGMTAKGTINPVSGSTVSVNISAMPTGLSDYIVQTGQNQITTAPTYMGQSGTPPTVAVLADLSNTATVTSMQQLAYSCLARIASDVAQLQSFWGSTATFPYSVLIITDASGMGNGEGGATHANDSPICWCDASFTDARVTEALFIAELSEDFMFASNLGWGVDGNIQAEALSRVLAEQPYPGVLESVAGGVYLTAKWYLTTSRPDLISTNPSVNVPIGGSSFYQGAVGCGVLFIYWLRSLGKTITQICQAGAPTLAGCYQNLGLGSANSAFPNFLAAINAKWPPGGNFAGFTNDDLWTSTTPTNPGSPPAIPPAPPTAPQGNVFLSIDGASPPVSATLDQNGNASFTLPSGQHTLTLTYPGFGFFTPIQAVNGSGGGQQLVNSVNFETGDFSQCKTQTGCTVVSTFAIWGKYSAQLAPANTVANITIGASPTTDYNLATAYYRWYMMVQQLPTSGDVGVCGFQDTTDAGKCFLHINSAGNLVFYDATGTVLKTGTTKLVPGTTYMIQASIATGGTGAAWAIQINGNPEISGTGNLGTANNGSIKLGGNSSSYTDTQYFDEIAISSTAFPGPVTPPAPGTPTGSVALTVDGIPFASQQTLNAQGSTQFTIPSPAAGTHNLSASFTSTDFAPATGTAILTVTGGSNSMGTIYGLTVPPDAIGVADRVQLSTNWIRFGPPGYVSSVGISDVVSILRISKNAPILRDALALADVFARFLQVYREQPEPLGVADAMTVQRFAFDQGPPDFIAIADKVTATLGAFLRSTSASDALGIADQITTALVHARILAGFPDFIGIADAFSRSAQSYRDIGDAIGLADAPLLLLFGQRNPTDGLALTDLVTTFVPGHPELSDAIGLADAFQSITFSFRDFQESIGIADAATLALSPLLGITAYWRVDTPIGRWRLGNPVAGQDWSIVAGEDKAIILVPDPGPVNITGWTLRWQLRAKDANVPNLITLDTFNGFLVIADALNGLIQLNLQSNQTVNLTFQRNYYWELARLDPGNQGSLARGALYIALADAAP